MYIEFTGRLYIPAELAIQLEATELPFVYKIRPGLIALCSKACLNRQLLDTWEINKSGKINISAGVLKEGELNLSKGDIVQISLIELPLTHDKEIRICRV